MRKILWKSDLWPYAVLFGLITLGCAAAAVAHAAYGQAGEAFTMGTIALVPLVVTAILGFTDRSGALQHDLAADPESSQRWAGRLSQELDAQAWDESGINPKNSDRAQAAMKGDPPQIG